MACLEPMGPDRQNTYMAMVVSALSMGKAKFDDLMFTPVNAEVKLQRYLEEIRKAQQ